MCYNTDVPQNPRARPSEPDTEGDVLCDAIYTNGPQKMSPQGQKRGEWLAGLRGGGNEEWLLHGSGVSFEGDAKVLELGRVVAAHMGTYCCH